MGFQRNVENFACAHCGAEVVGSGYTNHCPQCLWSKHVDVLPGDRAEECGGMMVPARLEGGTPNYVIVHRCERCGAERKIKVARDDNPDAIVALAKKAADSSK
jgi:hypothetical protein